MRTRDESRLDKYLSWIRWIEAELRQIEQEFTEPTDKGIGDASRLTGKEDERREIYVIAIITCRNSASKCREAFEEE